VCSRTTLLLHARMAGWVPSISTTSSGSSSITFRHSAIAWPCRLLPAMMLTCKSVLLLLLLLLRVVVVRQSVFAAGVLPSAGCCVDLWLAVAQLPRLWR